MQRIILKSIPVLIALLFINNYCFAIKVNGYIISTNSDTIYGTINLHNFNQVTGGFIINGFDMESLHYKVLFKTGKQRLFKAFYPEMIQGFGFSYNSKMYYFRSFLLKYKSIFKKERQKNRFLYLTYNGKINLYKDAIYVNNSANDPLNDKYESFYQYYLYNSNSKELIRIAVTEQIKTIRDLLKQAGIQEKFIQEVPEETKFKDIQTVLERYDAWLLAHTL